jgi:hypothetical protein
LLAAQHSLGDLSLARALLEISTGAHVAFFPLAVLTATLAVAILQGAVGARWVGWLSVLSSAACLVSVVIGNLDVGSMVPALGLLGFFITVIAMSVSMLRDCPPAPVAEPASRRQTPRTSSPASHRSEGTGQVSRPAQPTMAAALMDCLNDACGVGRANPVQKGHACGRYWSAQCPPMAAASVCLFLRGGP